MVKAKPSPYRPCPLVVVNSTEVRFLKSVLTTMSNTRETRFFEMQVF